MPGMTSAGIGSGLDLESLMKAYISAERQPQETRINQKKQTLDVTLSAVGSIRSSLSDFSTQLDKVSDVQKFLPRQALLNGHVISGSQSSDTNKDSDEDSTTNNSVPNQDEQPFSVSLGRRAVNGVYDVQVHKLASGSRLTSQEIYESPDQVISNQSGQLTLSAGEGDNQQSYSIDVDAGMTLGQLRQRINASAENFGVTANLINSSDGTHLVLDSSKSGIDNDGNPENGNSNDLVVSMETGPTGASETDENGQSVPFTPNTPLIDLVSNLSTTKNASGAEIEINGLRATSDTNEFANVISGVSIMAQDVTDKTEHLEIKPDVDSAVNNVHDFVDAYNKVITQVDQYSKSDSVQKGQDNSKHKPLSGDGMLRTMRFSLGRLASSGFTDPENPGRTRTLYGVGIKMERDGTLSVDDDVLRRELNTNLNSVGQFFASKNGVGERFSQFVDGYEQSGGILDHRQRSVQDQLKENRNDKVSLDERMDNYEKTLRRKYASFDQMMGGLHEQMNYVQSHLS